MHIHLYVTESDIERAKRGFEWRGYTRDSTVKPISERLYHVSVPLNLIIEFEGAGLVRLLAPENI